MAATSVQTVMPERETLLHISAANAEEHTIQTAVAAAETSKTQTGRGISLVGVLAGVLAVVALGAAPMLLATGAHLRKAATEPLMLQEIEDAMLQKYSMGSSPHEDCSGMGYCAEPGHRCYRKNHHWAGCRESCTPGIYEHDRWPHNTPWSCELIQDPDGGKRGMGRGALPHENCWQKDGRCVEPGHQCYKKNRHWAGCRASCTPGIYENDAPPHNTPWSCELIGSGHSDQRLPEKQIAVKSGSMSGLCLTLMGEAVTFMPCGRTATPWITRDGNGDFDLWQKYGIASGTSIRPASCPQSVAVGTAATAETECRNGWGLQWLGSAIELTKYGTGQFLCLSPDPDRSSNVGSRAVWLRCNKYSLTFDFEDF